MQKEWGNARIAFTCQCNGDDQPLRRVLELDTDGKRSAVSHVAATETDPNGQTFGKVVDGDGQNE